MKLIDKINSVSDLKALTIKELKDYACEVRNFIIESVTKTGGHLSSNLGTVEMTIALHYVFDSPKDKIIWDVGHQSYTHKIITGRKNQFDKLRQINGISGFPKMTENDCDAFTTGHASTSLSAGLGIAKARDIVGEDFNVISVIGDGALTGGMAYEALNNIGSTKAKMIVILNDNKMSISKNVGAMSNYLATLRLSKRYSKIKTNIKKGVSGLPFFGDKLVKVLEVTRDSIKSVFQSTKIFESFGLKYYGPVDGHNIENLIALFKRVKDEKKPIMIHLVTSKGYGYELAAENPSKYHGISPVTGKAEESFSKVLGDALCDLASAHDNVVGVSAAMIDGTGLENFAKKYPKRCFDVGIAEEHATTFAAGLAATFTKPYFAVYSTFLQRAFDSILHDVCLNNLPVTFCVDRAGAVGADGVTHQGIYDLSYLSLIPKITIFAPKDGNQLREAIAWSYSFNAPLAIRYPKSYIKDYPSTYKISLGKWDTIKKSNSNIYILCVGSRMLDIVPYNMDINVINACFIKPLDYDFLKSISAEENIIITLEDNALEGGFGSQVVFYLNSIGGKAKVVSLGMKDEFLDSYSVLDSFEKNGLTMENIMLTIKKLKK